MKIRSIVFTTLCAVVSLPAFAQAPAEAPPSDEVRTLSMTSTTCQQLLQAGGEDRNLLLALFHGYVAGKADKSTLDTVKMSFATDAVIDHCIEKPSDPLLAAFAAAGEDGR